MSRAEVATAAMVATDLASALSTLASHARTHCQHQLGIDMVGCDRCAARVRAIDALDDLDDANDRLELSIERMLIALDELRAATADLDPCCGCEDSHDRSDRAERRYRVWLFDLVASSRHT